MRYVLLPKAVALHCDDRPELNVMDLKLGFRRQSLIRKRRARMRAAIKEVPANKKPELASATQKCLEHMFTTPKHQYTPPAADNKAVCAAHHNIAVHASPWVNDLLWRELEKKRLARAIKALVELPRLRHIRAKHLKEIERWKRRNGT